MTLMAYFRITTQTSVMNSAVFISSNNHNVFNAIIHPLTVCKQPTAKTHTIHVHVNPNSCTDAACKWNYRYQHTWPKTNRLCHWRITCKLTISGGQTGEWAPGPQSLMGPLFSTRLYYTLGFLYNPHTIHIATDHEIISLRLLHVAYD